LKEKESVQAEDEANLMSIRVEGFKKFFDGPCVGAKEGRFCQPEPLMRILAGAISQLV
jgi:hypothetical protein